MRMKRKLEALTTVVSLALAVYVVHVWLVLIRAGRSPPKSLMLLAVISIAGAIGSAYRIEDVREVLALVPLKFGK